MKPLTKIFWEDLGEMLHVEEMLAKALFKMNAAAVSADLKAALQNYRVETQHQAERVKEIFTLAEMPVREKKCDAMMGMLVKGQQLIQRTEAGAVLDAVLVVMCQKVTGYKQVAYTGLLSWAKLLKEVDEETIELLQTLQQKESEAVTQFKGMATKCNQLAAETGGSGTRLQLERAR